MRTLVRFEYDIENVKLFDIVDGGAVHGAFNGNLTIYFDMSEDGKLLDESKQALRLEARRICRALKEPGMNATVSILNADTKAVYGRVFAGTLKSSRFSCGTTGEGMTYRRNSTRLRRPAYTRRWSVSSRTFVPTRRERGGGDMGCFSWLFADTDNTQNLRTDRARLYCLPGRDLYPRAML